MAVGFVGFVTSRLTYFLTASGPAGLEGAIEDKGLAAFCADVLLTPWRGGQVYYGGVLGGLATAAALARFVAAPGSANPMARVLDAGIFVSLWASALGRLGCFCAGCCFGEPNARFGVSFPPGSGAAIELARTHLMHDAFRPTLPLLPLQLVEASTSFVILGLLTVLVRRAPRPGLLFRRGALLYALERFTIEFWRFDMRGHLGPFSTSQWVSLAGLVALAAWWLLDRLEGAARLPAPRIGL